MAPHWLERTTIQIVGCHNVVASLHNVLQCISDSCSTAGHSQTCHTTLKGCHTVLKYPLRRVGQTAIDIAGIAQAKTVGSML